MKDRIEIYLGSRCYSFEGRKRVSDLRDFVAAKLGISDNLNESSLYELVRLEPDEIIERCDCVLCPSGDQFSLSHFAFVADQNRELISNNRSLADALRLVCARDSNSGESTYDVARLNAEMTELKDKLENEKERRKTALKMLSNLKETFKTLGEQLKRPIEDQGVSSASNVVRQLEKIGNVLSPNVGLVFAAKSPV